MTWRFIIEQTTRTYLFIIAILMCPVVASGQFNNGYNNRMPISIDESMVPDASNLTDFVLYLDVTSSNLTSASGKVTSSSGYDILISDSLGNTLDYEFIAYNGTSGRYQAWVKVPTLKDAGTTTLYLYYGNSLVTSDPSVTTTWSNNFSIVDHMESTGAANATGNGIDPTSDNTTSGTGLISGARSFNGTTQYVSYPSASTNYGTDFTTSMWINPTSNGSAVDLVYKRSGNNGFSFVQNGNDLQITTDKASVSSSANSITAGSWFHVTAVWNSASGRELYINGALVKSDGKNAAATSTAVDLTLSSTASPYAGLMDEVRISTAVRSAEWIATEYNNQSSPGTYITLGPEECSSVTYYSYISGNFNSSTTWTTDASGTTLTNSAIPTSCDYIVILSGRTVTFTTNNVELKGVTINSGATVNFGTTTGHTIGDVAGTGTLTLQSGTAPTGDYSSFGSSSGGTLKISDPGTVTFPTTVSEWNNVQLTSTNATADQINLASDLTINGNLTISATSGTVNFQFGNDATPRTLTVVGDVSTDAQSTLSVNSANATHLFELQGSLTANGPVDFANDAQYTPESSGAVSVMFTGLSDESLTGTGSQLDFYKLILYKGTDATYTLDVDHSALALFGPTDSANGSTSSPYSTDNPQIKKPLWIRAGTLRLRTGISIDQLTSGGEHFTIPNAGSLWIDGANVSSVLSSGSATNTGIVVLGNFQISGGSFNGNQSSGILYGGNGSLTIGGGTVNISQLRPISGLTKPTNAFSYTQTGGDFICRGDVGVSGNVDASYALFDLSLYTSAFNLSDGNIILRDISAANDTGGLYLGINPSNAVVSGGVFEFDLVGGVSAYLHSSIGVPSLKVSRLSGTGNATVLLARNTFVIDSTNIQLNGELDGNGFDFTSNGELICTGTLTQGTGRWTAEGSNSRTWNITGSLGSFTDFYINLDNSSDSLIFSGPSSFTTTDTLSLSNGILHLSATDAISQSTLINQGSIRGTGGIEFNGNTAYNWGGSGSGTVNDVVISGSAASSSTVTLTASQVINGTLTFTSGNTNTSRILNASAYKITLPSSSSITGAGANGTGANGIQAGGSASDLGVRIQIDQTTTVFPFVQSSSYTPATLTLSGAPSSYGYVNVKQVNTEHPNVTENNQSLTKYWTVTSDVSLGSTTTDWTFIYLDSDVVGTETNYNEGYFSGVFWFKDGTGSVNTTTNEIFFTGSDYNTSITGNYTAGNTVTGDPFGAVAVFYSRTSGPWSNTSSWSLTSHNVDDPPANAPLANSVVVIGDNDSIWTASNNQAAGALTIDANSVLDVGTTTGHNFGLVDGTGSLRMESGTFPSGQFGDFLSASGGTIVLYTRGASRTYSGLNISCRNMKWVLEAKKNMDLSGTMNISGNLTVRSLNTFNQDINLDGVSVSVEGDMHVFESDLFIVNSGGSSTLDIGGKLTVESNATMALSVNSAVIHNISIGDSLVLNGSFDIYDANDTYAELTFDATGDGAMTGTATADIYRLNINKGSDTTSQFWLSHTGTLSLQSADWLVLTNGNFVYQRADTRTVSSGNSGLTIPATAGICMDASGGVLNLITGASNTADLTLAGHLCCDAGTVNVGSSASAFGNDIFYSTTGSPSIEVNGGTLNVNGQISRTTSSTQGSLNMIISSGGAVTISGKNTSANRGKLEITNSGKLTMSGNSTLTFQRGGASTISDFYLTGATSDLSGGTISFVSGTGITTDEETFKINSSVALNHLIIDGASGDLATVKLQTNSLSLTGDLTVTDAFSSLNTNGLNVTTRGDLYLNGNGTWSGSTLVIADNANFTGAASGSNALYNLTVQTGNTLSFLSSATMNCTGAITVESSASVTLGTGALYSQGDVDNSGTITSTSASATQGLRMNGTSTQTLSSTGTIDNLIINNAANVELGTDLEIAKQLQLTYGQLFIGSNKLTLDAGIVVTGTFTANTMVSTNGVLTDAGVHYNLNSGAQTILFPVGSNNKYCPASYNFTALTSSGTIQLLPVDATHPGTTDTNDTQLDYYWDVISSGLGTYTVSHQYRYNNVDVNGTEADYVAGVYDGTNWTPINGIPNSVDPTNDSITIWNVDYLDGTITAGDTSEFGEAPTYYSRSGSGFYNWNDKNAWSNDSHVGPATSAAPTGTGKIVIAAGDSIATNGDLRVCQSVENHGTLYVGSTIGHNFGEFSGDGTLILDVYNSSIYMSPAGIFSSFVSDTGGTWVYSGTADATILNALSTYDNLKFTGTSTKSLGSQNLLIYGDFILNDGFVSNSGNINLTVRGNWVNNAGSSAFSGGTGTVSFTSASSTINGSTTFNNLTENLTSASDSLSVQSGDVIIAGNFTQTNGVLNFDGGNLDFRGNVTRQTWYSDSASSLTFAGSGTISSDLLFSDASPQLTHLTLTRSTAVNLGSDLRLYGTLTLGSSNFSIGDNTLSISQPLAGTSTSLIGGATSRIRVFGTGSGISLPSSVSQLQWLEVNNTNGLTLSGSTTINDSIRAYAGDIDANGNTLSLANDGWIERTAGSFVEDVSYTGNGNLIYNNSSSLNTSGEVNSNKTAVQTVIVSGSGALSLASPLYVNGTLTLNTELTLASDSLVLYGGVSGSGTLASSGNGKLVLRGSGNLTLPSFNASAQALETLLTNRSGTHTLSSSVQVDSKLMLQSGYVDLSTFDLTLGASVVPSDASSTSFVATTNTGVIVQEASSLKTYTIPCGDLTSTAEYSPLFIDLTAASLGSNPSWSISVTDGTSSNCPGSTDYITRYWDVSATDISSSEGTVTMQYSDADIVGTEANIVGKRYNGTYCVNGDSSVVGSNQISVFIDGYGEFSGREIDLASEPTSASTTFAFTNVETVQFDLGWASGDGQQRLVVAKQGSPVTFSPEDYHHYSFDTQFGQSPEVATGEYVLYRGSGSSFTATGLTANKTYFFEIFEFNKQDTISENYLTTVSASNDQNTAIEMDLTIFFEGPLDTIKGEMSTTLGDSGLLPLAQPYSSIYSGTESVASIPTDVSDWVLVQLYDAPAEGDITSGNKVHEGAYFVKKNGQVVDIDGTSLPTILPSRSGALRVVVQSRNHLIFASADSLENNSNIHVLDTRTNGSISTIPTNTLGGWKVVPAGQIETSTPTAIDAPDALQIWIQRNTSNTYRAEDINWDGIIDATDRAMIFWNIGVNAVMPAG